MTVRTSVAARRRRFKKVLMWILLVFATLWALATTLLRHPSPLFAYRVQYGALSLYSDRAFDPAAGRAVLALAQAKLRRSGFDTPEQTHAIYICNARWRQRLFFTYAYGVGGINYYPASSNVFLRDASIERNRLIGPDGRELPGDRSLDYFIAHEAAHTLTGRALGWIDFHRLPRWKREGYADYVGKGGAPDFAEAQSALRADAASMDWHRSGSYARYHLMVAYLLDRKGWDERRVLNETVDEQALTEDLLRAAAPSMVDGPASSPRGE